MCYFKICYIKVVESQTLFLSNLPSFLVQQNPCKHWSPLQIFYTHLFLRPLIFNTLSPFSLVLLHILSKPFLLSRFYNISMECLIWQSSWNFWTRTNYNNYLWFDMLHQDLFFDYLVEFQVISIFAFTSPK